MSVETIVEADVFLVLQSKNLPAPNFVWILDISRFSEWTKPICIRLLCLSFVPSFQWPYNCIASLVSFVWICTDVVVPLNVYSYKSCIRISEQSEYVYKDTFIDWFGFISYNYELVNLHHGVNSNFCHNTELLQARPNVF